MPRLFRRSLRHLTLFAQVCGAVAASLVALLVVLAASPEAHAWFHQHADSSHAGCPHPHDSHPAEPDSDDGCAVTLFAHGVTSASLCHFACESLPVIGRTPPVSASVPRPPALFLPPGCGPPAV